MRLIDLDALKEDLKTEMTNLYLNGLKGTPRSYSELNWLIDRLEEQPIALDTDIVIEKLEDYLFERYCIEDDPEIAKIINGEDYNG